MIAEAMQTNLQSGLNSPASQWIIEPSHYGVEASSGMTSVQSRPSVVPPFSLVGFVSRSPVGHINRPPMLMLMLTLILILLLD
jgi:hypothetical protein